MNDQITAPGGVQVPDAKSVERYHLAGLGAGPDVHVVGAVEGLHRHSGAKGRRHHRDRQRAVQVIALPLEDQVRRLHHLEEEVARRPAAGSGLALACQLDVRAVLDAGRDADLHRPAGADPPVAVALRAGMRKHGAVAAAVRAGPAGHYLAEEGPPHLADLATAGADLPGLRTVSYTHL